MAFQTPQFGITMFPTDYAIQPVALARAVEERGFDSLFFPEHTHIPASRDTPFPGGGDLPEMYWHTHRLTKQLLPVYTNPALVDIGSRTDHSELNHQRLLARSDEK